MKKFFKKNWKKLLLTFSIIFLIFSTFYLIFAIALYKGIETKIRVVGCLALINALALFIVILKKFKKKLIINVFVITAIISLIYSTTITVVAYKINNIYNKISRISEKSSSTYSTSIITRKESSADGIEDIKNNKIAVINDKEDYEIYDLANIIIDENNLKSENVVKYDNGVELLKDLLDGKIDFAILPTNYDARFSSNDGLENISEKTKIIFTKTEKKEQEISSNKKAKSLNEPFTILIMGVDTVGDGIGSGGGGDALILVTFNPKTTNTTILSVPRDTYMPISCLNGRKNKITNAGWHGESCISESLEDFFDIEIDYHVRINFNGVVQLVDALGGVEVDVPYAFCEQNSKRQWGKNTIFVKSGKQKLNGEQALAFARHRKTTQYMASYCGASYVTHPNYWNDFIRGQNQQVVIKALMQKFKDIDNFSTVENLLDTISKNIETDISTDSLLSLYNLGKNILKKSSSVEEAFNMQKLYLSGEDARIYDYSFKHNAGSKLSLYNYSAYEESKDAIIKAMKRNLGLEPIVPVKTFTFSIKTPYEEYVIGRDVGTTSTLELLPSFIGKEESEAKAYANSHDINLIVNYVTGSRGQFVGQILSQNVPMNTDIDMLNSVTITVVESIPQTTIIPDPIEDDNDIDNTEDDNNPNENDDTTENNNNDNQDINDLLP